MYVLYELIWYHSQVKYQERLIWYFNILLKFNTNTWQYYEVCYIERTVHGPVLRSLLHWENCPRAGITKSVTLRELSTGRYYEVCYIERTVHGPVLRSLLHWENCPRAGITKSVTLRELSTGRYYEVCYIERTVHGPVLRSVVGLRIWRKCCNF